MDQEVLSVDALIAENGRLRADNAELRVQNAELRATLDLVQRKFLEVTDLMVQVQEENRHLKARVLTLEEQLLEAQRESKRQAAPFRRRERIPESQHKKPGRAKGHPPTWRPKPEADEVIDVPLDGVLPHRGPGHSVEHQQQQACNNATVEVTP